MDRRPAAFFDLDKTVIAKASMVAMGRPLYREGLISRWLLLRALAGQLVYVWFGADEAKLARMRDNVLRLTAGWDRDTVRRIARDAIEEVIEPIVYAEALDLIAAHQAAGEPVYLVSASPEEIVAPLAEHLRVDGYLATIPRVGVDGRYTGEVDRYCYGAEKVVAMVALAEAKGFDLATSSAYSDSATDEPMLAAVGHPVAVNPDRELLRIAREREWEIRSFVRPVRLRDRIPRPDAAQSVAVGGGLVAVIAGTVTFWYLRRTIPVVPPPPPPGTLDRARQAWRTFLAATAARAASTRSRRSFFMDRAG
ncbi:MAG: HAD-IB family hydrolase [Acidimicrobiia bacterium]|nr:HAD-IB family hydrolase [Acidimicrobiia bacterium]